MLHYDSLAAGQSASGQATVSDQDQDFGLGPTLRGLFQLLERRRIVSYRHVKGHTGQAGNELADAVASAQCGGHIEDNTPPIQTNPIARTSRDFMQWTFAAKPASDRPQLGNGTISFPFFHAAESLPFQWRPGELCRPVTPLFD